MNLTTVLSWSAIIISLLSFIAAGWSALISHRALTHSREAYQNDKKITFERERSELLEIINTGRNLLDKTRIEVGALKATFDVEPQAVKNLLLNYTQLFTEYLPALEGGIRQANSLWDEVAEWSDRTGIHAIVHHQARFKALLHNDQVAHDQGLSLITTFQKKLLLARHQVAALESRHPSKDSMQPISKK